MKRLTAAVAIYVVLGAAFLAPALEDGKILLQAAHLYQFFPWKGYEASPPADTNPLLSDQTLSFHPYREFARSSLRDGELPLWNPFSLGGVPFLGNLTSSVFYPANLAYVVSGGAHALVWIALVKLVLAALFMYAYAGALGAGFTARLTGGALFALCGFNVLWMNHPHSSVFVVLPLILYAFERGIMKHDRARSVLFSAAIAVQFLAGHLETSFFVMFVVSCYAVFRISTGGEGTVSAKRRLWLTCLFGLAGTSLAAIQLLPFVEYLRDSAVLQSRLALSALPENDFSVEKYRYLRSFIDPTAYGSPLTGDYVGPINYNELYGGFVGFVPVVAAVLGPFFLYRRKVFWFYAVLALFAVGMSYQVPYLYPAFKALPGFQLTHTHRLLGMAGFSLIMIFVLLLDRAAGNPRSKRAWSVAVTLVAVLAVVDLFRFGRDYNPVMPTDKVFATTPAIEFLQHAKGIFRIASPLSTFPHESHLPYGIQSIRGYDAIEIRAYTEFVSLLSNHRHAGHFVFATPYHEVIDSKLFDLLNVRYFVVPPGTRLSGGVELVYEDDAAIYENIDVLPRAFIVGAAIRVPDAAARLKLLADPRFDPLAAVVVEDESAPGLRGSVAGRALIENYSNGRIEITVETDADAYLVLTDNYFPGWKATIDGASVPVYRAYHTFRSVVVPDGRSKVVFEYDPLSFRVGSFVSGGALCLLMVVLGQAAWRRRGGGLRAR